MNIFHITPHLGGGVGTVLLNWLCFDKLNCHKVATLDFANENAIKICNENNIELFSKIKTDVILNKIKNADIVLIHFWNHPLLYDFLIRNEIPYSRVVFWAHVSGANPPYVFNKKLFDICDKFVFTTPISYKYAGKNPKFASILSTGGTEKYRDIKPVAHNGYNIGYIGTVDFAKMHESFIETLDKTNADRIFVVGGDREKEIFRNSSDRYVVTGKVKDITQYLEQFDVFSYLLNPNHYGTGEQVLQEAMSVGIVPVVLNNDCEKSLVEHNKTGLVANNLDEYVKYINLLKDDINLRIKLSQNAKKYAQDNFSLKNLSDNWQNIFNEIIKVEKTAKKWQMHEENITSYDIFKESLGDYCNIFENKFDDELKEILKKPCWQSDTKGTPKQYYSFLGGEELKRICDLY